MLCCPGTNEAVFEIANLDRQEAALLTVKFNMKDISGSNISYILLENYSMEK